MFWKVINLDTWGGAYSEEMIQCNLSDETSEAAPKSFIRSFTWQIKMFMKMMA